MAEESKLIFSYNSFLVDFLLLAKQISPEIKQRVKENYRSVDKREPSHVDFGAKNLPLDVLSQTKPADLGKAELDANIVDGITVRDVVEYAAADDASDDDKDAASCLRTGLLRVMYVLASLARLRQLESTDGLEPLLELIMRIQAVGSWAGWPDPAPAIGGLDKTIDGVEDACVRGLLSGLFELCVTQVTSKKALSDVPEALRETFASIQNSRIGSIAKEIAEEIDFSGIDTSKPEQWLDLANITNPNSFLGNIVGKLGTKITAKMQNGELNQEDIFADAMSLMKSMGVGGGKESPNGRLGSDLMQSMMASMMSAKMK